MNAPVNINRRTLLVSAAALGGGMALSISTASQAGTAAGKASELCAWVRIDADDTVTVQVPTPEIGNGVMTQCALTVTEELGCAWSHVHAEVASANRNFLENNVYSKGGMLGFFAGRSTGPDRFKILLQAGASARERLKAAAAQTWKVPVSEIDARESVLTHRPTGRTLRYGQMAALAGTIQLDAEPAPKPQSEWTTLGKVAPGKLNNAAIANGTAVFGMDVRQPNMLYAALMQSPVQGGKLKSHDFEAIRKMPGVHSVVVIDPAEPRHPLGAVKAPFPTASSTAQSGVAVVADHYWQARQALEALPVTWDDGKGAEWKTTEQLHKAALDACAAPGKSAVKTSGDVAAALAAPGGVTVEGTYLTPLCDHVTMEPLNGTALVTADRVDLWHPSQHPQQAFSIAVEETGVDPKNVHVHQTFVGGGFGRRVFGDDARMVLAVAKKVPGRPVHVIWSREESIRQGRYRALEAASFTAKLGPDGLPKALRVRTAGVGHSPEGLGNSAYAAGGIPNILVESTPIAAHFMTGPYRGPSYNTNAFFIESFIDECAAAAKIDPLEYRLKLLSAWGDPAWAACLKTVAAKSGWGKALPKGQGRGVAISNWGGGGKPKEGTTVACAAHVEVSPKGELKIHSLDVAFDSGRIVNRNAVLAQLEGGTVFGMNMSLMEELNVENGRIVEGNYDTYPMLRMADIPVMRFHFDALSQNDRFAELGEPPVGPVGPAITNAIFAATGKRIRQTPLRKQDLAWA